MTFIQPWLLAALPLIALPVIIHLINQRRYQTVDWGAMKFLLAANRMSRGYARLRRWLIMAMRVLAVAGLIFAVSRPLASGWLGVAAGGKADTTIILLDRSPSMQHQAAGGISKLDTARRELVDTLETLGSTRWVLIDSATVQPQEIASPAALIDAPHTTGASASADLPEMMQAAHDYIKANNPGHTEIWIASDLREHDWRATSGRWASLREAFIKFPQEVRFHLLAYATPKGATGMRNAAIRVTDARRETVGNQAQLVVSLVITRDLAGESSSTEKQTLPLRFEIDGARSEMTVEIASSQYELKDHRIPLNGESTQGWGRVSLPADSNPADDQAFFVFDEPPVRRTAVVAEEPERVRAMRLAASIAPSPGMTNEAEIVTADSLQTLAWEELALVLWQAPLPTGKAAELVNTFVQRGGQVVFFPPRDPTSRQAYGMEWQHWVENKKALATDTWRGDQGLLANTQSGGSLPVGKWKVKRHCMLAGEATTLASLPGGIPLLSRVTTDRGGVYFCSTTADPRDSSLAADGVVLYATVQRMIDDGAKSLGATRLQNAGQAFPPSAEPWRQTADGVGSPGEAVLSTDYQYHRGVYASDDKLLAVNRPLKEDLTSTVAETRVYRLFEGLDFDRVDRTAGTGGGIVQEIWRLFLGAMLLALVVEAALCLPKITQPAAVVPSAARPSIPTKRTEEANRSEEAQLTGGGAA
ncbi:BatA domain-containing protein [Adhaeretor mobilis]|uniref:Aerotolerance regulator N-terminal domain-containing protein n=1 Tax=Adhaeretor mobilis TaxID=1930276 RepID=A0A517MXL4_9BACT|nr:BatA domain-containing protein [Adhaeretor mobilis]QDS99620.1 hypothetical protein HG15A2_29460 [Adhaeretor mobilis]